MRILILGGGIGGLTCAAMLTRASHDVVLVEREPALRDDGAGILLPSRIVRMLDRSGAAIHDRGMPLQTMSITTPDGRSRGVVRNRWAFSRPELVAAIARAAQPADVRCATVAEEIREDLDGVSCLLGGRPARFDLVIAADGLSSTTRTMLAPRADVRDAGQTCWRAIVDIDSGTHGTEMWNGRERIGVIPLPDSRTYVYVVSPPSGTMTVPRPSGLPPREEAAVSALQTLGPSRVLRHTVRELERPHWGSTRIALLGDAAHAITPNLGLGAALAVEDAAAVVAAVTRTADFRGYGRRRHLPVRGIQLASRALGRLAHDSTRGALIARRAAGFDRGEPAPPA